MCREREQLELRLAALDRKESYLLDLAADEEWPKDKLRDKIQALRSEKQGIQRTIQQAERKLAAGRELLERALDLLERPQELYAASGEVARSILNKAFLHKLYVDGERVTDHDLAEPFDVLFRLYEVQRGRVEGGTRRDGDQTPETTRAGLLEETGSRELDIMTPLT